MRHFPVKHDHEQQPPSVWPFSLMDWSDFDSFFGKSMRLFPADVKETDKSYELSVDLPGYKKEQISLDYHNDTLTIQASREEEQHEEDDKGAYIRRERVSGSYSRQFYLPHVKEDGIEAAFEDGVLKISMPKTKVDEPERLRIQIK